MTHQDSETTRLREYIAKVLPWAHGHQLKGITTVVSAIIHKQTGNQAALARGLGNQEAAVKHLSRLLRRVASRRQGRWELSLVSAMVELLQGDRSLFAYLSPSIRLDLDARLVYVS